MNFENINIENTILNIESSKIDCEWRNWFIGKVKTSTISKEDIHFLIDCLVELKVKKFKDYHYYTERSSSEMVQIIQSFLEDEQRKNTQLMRIIEEMKSITESIPEADCSEMEDYLYEATNKIGC
jgi:hypothetical protein